MFRHLIKLVSAVLMLFCLCPTVCASFEAADVSENFDFASLGEALPDSVKDKIGSPQAPNTENISINGFLGFFIAAVANAVKPFCESLCVLMCICVACAFVKKFADASGNAGISAACGFAFSLALSSALFVQASSDCELLLTYLLQLKSYYAAALPVMVSVYSFGAYASSALACGASSTAVLSLIQLICEKLIVPCVRICLSLAMTQGLSEISASRKLCEMFSSFTSKTLSLMTALVSSGMLLQSKLAAAADSIAVRSLKFAASGFIPIVGSSVAEATATVFAGLSKIRSALGVFGIAAIIYLIIPTVVKLCCRMLVFTVCEVMLSSLGCNREAALIKGVHSVYPIMLAAAICCTLCFVLACTVFIGSV